MKCAIRQDLLFWEPAPSSTLEAEFSGDGDDDRWMTTVDRVESPKSDDKTKAEGMSILGQFGLGGLAVGQD